MGKQLFGQIIIAWTNTTYFCFSHSHAFRFTIFRKLNDIICHNFVSSINIIWGSYFSIYVYFAVFSLPPHVQQNVSFFSILGFSLSFALTMLLLSRRVNLSFLLSQFTQLLSSVDCQTRTCYCYIVCLKLVIYILIDINIGWKALFARCDTD